MSDSLTCPPHDSTPYSARLSRSFKLATIRLVLHTRWGHPDQKSKVVTLLLDSNRMQEIGEIEFEFQPR